MINNKELIHYIPKFLEQTKNGVIVTDPNQNNNPIVFVNDSSCNIFGYEKKDFLGRNCKFLQGKLTNQPAVKKIAQAVQNEKAIFVTLKNFSKDGKLIYNNLSISPIYDDDGNLKFFLGIQRDATKENLLQYENQELIQKELENTKFNAIGRLSGGLSHELNTPITVINGTMEMMQSSIHSLTDESIKADLSDDLKILKQEFKKLSNIVESLREVSDTNVFEKQPVNLYRTLIFSLRLMYNKINLNANVSLLGDEFTLELDRDKEVYEVFADPNRLEQLWLILIDNALDQFIKKGTPKKQNNLSIEIQQKQNALEVFVKDNGGGFEPEVLENIFTPFNSTRDHKGLGMGLIVAKQIVEKHNFEIMVSNNNLGATIKIYIPFD
jgi:PAS domain S-box-containing protein